MNAIAQDDSNTVCLHWLFTLRQKRRQSNVKISVLHTCAATKNAEFYEWFMVMSVKRWNEERATEVIVSKAVSWISKCYIVPDSYKWDWSIKSRSFVVFVVVVVVVTLVNTLLIPCVDNLWKVDPLVPCCSWQASLFYDYDDSFGFQNQLSE